MSFPCGHASIGHNDGACCAVCDLGAKLEVAEARVARLHEALTRIEWAGYDETAHEEHLMHLCPFCDSPEVDGHTDDCKVGCALSESSESVAAWLAAKKAEERERLRPDVVLVLDWIKRLTEAGGPVKVTRKHGDAAARLETEVVNREPRHSLAPRETPGTP